MEVGSWLHWIFSHLTTDFKQLWWLNDWVYDTLDHFWSPRSNTVSTCETPSWKRPASIQSCPNTDSPAATLRIAKGLQNNCCLIYKHRLPTLYNQSECAKQLVCNSSLCNQRLESTGWQLRIFFIKQSERLSLYVDGNRFVKVKCCIITDRLHVIVTWPHSITN